MATRALTEGYRRIADPGVGVADALGWLGGNAAEAAVQQQAQAVRAVELGAREAPRPSLKRPAICSADPVLGRKRRIPNVFTATPKKPSPLPPIRISRWKKYFDFGVE